MRIYNNEIAQIFEDVADLLAIKGTDEFRIRAYKDAAITIRRQSQNIEDMVDQGKDLSKLPNIGKDLAGKINTIVKTGELPLLKNLKKQFPIQLIELLNIKGLGPERVAKIFGVTKVQLGVQSLNEKILEANTRGHSREEVFKAMELLRLLGVNMHIHWMCNLYKGNPKLDFEDFEEIFSNERAKPDEIKMYPCSMVEGIKLYEIYKKGGYEPYTTQTLIELLAKCKELVPNYCRINRLMRDIPSQLIMVGNKSTNLREKVQDFMKEKNKSCKCIRCREIKNKEHGLLKLKKTIYQTSISTEYFLEYVTEENKIAGFLRLSIYKKRNALLVDTPAMVRELHIYGTSLNLKDKSKYSNQHKGFGSKLLLEAEKIAKDLKIEKMAIISGVGTRNYYKKRGYVIEKEYGYALKNLK